MTTEAAPQEKSPLREIVQPFTDLVHAPRALWGINLAYVIEGMVYFGMLNYLAIHFSSFVFAGVEHADEWSHSMVAVLTSGITIAMLVLGFVADKWGIRQALLSALFLMFVGRSLISAAPTVLNLRPAGPWSPLHLVTMAGILLVIIGYGMYQPAAYAGVRKFTTPKTAGMGFAMLYALMNLGGWLPTFAFLLRDRQYLGLGIPGTYWVYTGFTLIAFLATAFLLAPRTVAEAERQARLETEALKAAQPKSDKELKGAAPAETEPARPREYVPVHLWIFVLLVLVAIYWRAPGPWKLRLTAVLALIWLVVALLPPTARWLARHPLADGKFFFFIFAFIPVQTLFTYNWLILPQYINRSFAGWIGEKFEIASNLNPILIFILVPIIAAATQKWRVYDTMILGTLVMAAPAFLNAIGPYPWALFGYIVIMTVGEAIWQPRFLQYAAEVAPRGRTGEYMGVAQLPWFLTKLLVPLLYSGYMMDRYCPATGPKNTKLMWFVFGCIAISSTILLVLARPWMGRDFKTKSE